MQKLANKIKVKQYAGQSITAQLPIYIP